MTEQALCKWVGSKRGLLASSAQFFPQPDHGGSVVVPFLGGGSVAAWYASKGCKVIASDINSRLMNAHVEVQRNVDLVITQLARIENTWHRAIEPLPDAERDIAGRVIFEQQRSALDDGSPTERAARFLFIVRAGFNGLYRENASGECTTAYGKPQPSRDLIAGDELRAYSEAIRNVALHCEDFAVTCARALPGWAAYLDSPYEGTFTGYALGDWSAAQTCLPGMGRINDRERLAAMLAYLDSIGARWSNSDSDTPTTRSLYARWQIDTVSRVGTVNSNGDDRAAVSEVLARNWQSAQKKAA